MHFVKAKEIMSAKNGMNLYRGCSLNIKFVWLQEYHSTQKLTPYVKFYNFLGIPI